MYVTDHTVHMLTISSLEVYGYAPLACIHLGYPYNSRMSALVSV